jgi:hypothetical protein
MAVAALPNLAEDTTDWATQLQLWGEAKRRRDLVLNELAQRLARQAESDDLLLARLTAARARLDVGSDAGTQEVPALAA